MGLPEEVSFKDSFIFIEGVGFVSNYKYFENIFLPPLSKTSMSQTILKYMKYNGQIIYDYSKADSYETGSLGVEQVEVAKEDSQWYNLQGYRLLGCPKKRGIYILRSGNTASKVFIK